MMEHSHASKKMGWEVAQDLEAQKRGIFERMIPEWRHLRLALGGVIVFFGVFLIGILKAWEPFW